MNHSTRTVRTLLLIAWVALVSPGCEAPPQVDTDDAGSRPDVMASADSPRAEDDAQAGDVAGDAAPRADGTPATDAATVGDAAPADGRGEMPGPSCAEGCPAGQECIGSRCLRVSGLGEACGFSEGSLPPPPLCARGTDCVRRDGRAQCVSPGSTGASCRATRPHCDDGLGCDVRSRTCVSALPEAAFCSPEESVCAEGTHCAAPLGTYRCVRDGAPGHACRHPAQGASGLDRSALCDPGLTCVPTPSTSSPPPLFAEYEGVCYRSAARGSPCDERVDRCVVGSSCVAAEGPLRPRRCVPDGSFGARCVPLGSPRCPIDGGRCDAGLECANYRPETGGVCVRPVEAGGACGALAGPTRCPEGHGCSSADPMEVGRCVPAGVVAGSQCRAGGECDGALVCSRVRYQSTCRAVAGVGDACDVGATQTLCPVGTLCLAAAGASTGACAAPTAESEPNDVPTSPPTAPAASRLYAAALGPGDARDCFAVRVADGASLRLELASLTAPDGAGFSPLVSLFDPRGDEVGRWAPQPTGEGPTGALARLLPTEVSILRAMRGGAWSVCISRRAATDAERYLLALAVVPG